MRHALALARGSFRTVAPFLGVLVVIAVACGPRPASARERVRTPIAQRLAARLAEPDAASARVGAVVVTLPSGSIVFDRNAMTPLVPGSVAKIPTMCAALDLLGPGYRYETTIEARGSFDPATGRLDGDVVLRGTGDPGLSKRGHEDDPMWPFSVLARGVRASGVVHVSGALVLDDGAFDRSFLHPSWKASDCGHSYGAPVAGITFNDSCVTVTVRGGASEDARGLVSFPSTAGPWPVSVDVRTDFVRSPEVGGAFAVDGPRLRVFGRIGTGSDAAFDVPVPDPLAFAGHAMKRALTDAGVTIGSVRVAATREDRAAGAVVARVESPLPATLRVLGRRSQNLYAALVFKACGVAREGEGSWAAGERAVLDAIGRRGVPPDGLRLVDGSGLSEENRLSAAALVRLLLSFEHDPLRGPVLRDALAVPGEEGTLEKRFRDRRDRTRLHAKTGTLSGVHALAGYVDARPSLPGDPGVAYAFAFLVNRGNRDVADDLAAILLDE